MYYLQFSHLPMIEKNSFIFIFYIFCVSLLHYFVYIPWIICTLLSPFLTLSPLAIFKLFLDSHLISSKSLLATRISHSHPVVFLALGFGRHVTPTDAVFPTRAFAFSSRVSEHSIVPVRTISSGRTELALSFYQPVDSPAATALLANATDIPRSTRPTRIGNQFRKTVINGRRRTVRAPGVRGPNRAACGNRAAFEWSLPVFVDDSAKTLRALDFPVTSLCLFTRYHLLEIKTRSWNYL